MTSRPMAICTKWSSTSFLRSGAQVDREQADPRQHYKHVPSDYFDVFASRGVRAVVRLNTAQYDARSFTEVSVSRSS